MRSRVLSLEHAHVVAEIGRNRERVRFVGVDKKARAWACQPAEYVGPQRTTSIGWLDPRTERGELLWPERFGPDEMTSLKRSLGSYPAAGQSQQRPAPAEGGLHKRHWWRFWQPQGADLPPVVVRYPDGSLRPVEAVELPAAVEEQMQSWDCAFKDLETSDYVVGQVWARLGADCFLLDQVRDRMDCPTTVRSVRELTAKWPYTFAKLVEDKANGPAVIQMLQHEIAGIIPVNPQGGKMTRAAAVSPLVEAGNIYLPHPQHAPWVEEFIEECAAFPNGAHDDQVDAATQALLRWAIEPEQEYILVYDASVRISDY